ncbi:hypothetical protein [Plantactinospora sp. BB1]|uniref:hypothetical protein n=1 Tax=Plantactinospora sp. BB1 TaxID=2071627 RepID=UPI000D171471|nr:hypothetical protein [Plantactinospora sp. BB1]AVT38151.1 hypothetical protein C6W10_18800 [Plantactinospora sp. BB1]
MSFTSRGSTPKPQGAVALLVVSALAVLWAAAMLSPIGGLINAYMFVYMAFFAGPATLVALSLTVMVGLVATDRIVLLIRHRVLLQSAHRSLGIIAVFALVLHVLTKIAAGHISPDKALLPFVNGADVYVGLGTVAGAAMVAVLWTGLVRARFAGVGKPWLWRTLHSISYAAWPIALVHGLQAGRAAATWVTLSYLLCVALVLALLGVRLSVSLGRKRAELGQTTGALSPVGRAGKPGRAGRPGKPGPVGRTSSMAPAKRRTADEIRASRANSPAREGGRSRRSRWEDDTLTGRRGGGRDNRWDDSDAVSGRRGQPAGRAGRDERDTYGGRPDDTQGGGRRRRESLSDLRGGSESAIDAWARAGELDSTYAPRSRSDRFAVPEVPPPGSMSGGRDQGDAFSDAELPWDSPRRWAAGDEPGDPWDRPRGGEDDAMYRPPRAWDDTSAGDEPGESRRSRRDTDGSGRRSWREPDDEPTPSGATRAGRRRRAADEEPDDRSGRHSRARGADDAEESTAEWGRAARYEPNLVARADDDDDDDEKPALIDLATRRSRRSDEPSGRSSRRRDDPDEAAEEGAYWTSLKGEAR